ncbi:MAG: hypothetical protein LBC74_04560 [Planctomycetaceae bacterium]|jgi:hypothetical protein|nr:hypothetical protein [Planctomycetaceae bacterium]
MISLPENNQTFDEESQVVNGAELEKELIDISATESYPLPTDDDQTSDKIAAATTEIISTVQTKDISVEIAEINVFLQQLVKDFETKLKYDATKQGQIDKLYNENQSFKEGLLKKFRHLLILTVIEQIDDVDKQITYFGNASFSEENYRKLLSSYQEVARGFQDVLLEKFDVQNYRCEPNSTFDPKRQRSLKTCPINDQSKHKLVKQSLRSGYETDDGFILRPEMVEVYVFDSKQSIT